MRFFLLLLCLIVPGIAGARDSVAKIHRDLGQADIDDQHANLIETRRAVFISDYGTTQGGISFWREQGRKPMVTVAFPWNRKGYLIPERLTWTSPVSEAAWQQVLAVPFPPKAKSAKDNHEVDENGEPVIMLCIHGRTGLVESVERRSLGWRTQSVIANACDDDRPLEYWQAIAEIAADAIPNCRIFVEEIFRTDGFDDCVLATSLDQSRAKILQAYRRNNWVDAIDEDSRLTLDGNRIIEDFIDIDEAFGLSENEELQYPGIYKVEAYGSDKLLAHFVIRRDRDLGNDKAEYRHAFGNMILRANANDAKPVSIDAMTIGPFKSTKR